MHCLVLHGYALFCSACLQQIIVHGSTTKLPTPPARVFLIPHVFGGRLPPLPLPTHGAASANVNRFAQVFFFFLFSPEGVSHSVSAATGRPAKLPGYPELTSSSLQRFAAAHRW